MPEQCLAKKYKKKKYSCYYNHRYNGRYISPNISVTNGSALYQSNVGGSACQVPSLIMQTRNNMLLQSTVVLVLMNFVFVPAVMHTLMAPP